MEPSIGLVDDFGKIDKARRRMKLAFFAGGATFCSCFVPAAMLSIWVWCQLALNDPPAEAGFLLLAMKVPVVPRSMSAGQNQETRSDSWFDLGRPSHLFGSNKKPANLAARGLMSSDGGAGQLFSLALQRL
ncbi:hypothetical protein [Mesorhizobium sp. M0684]|uniref:hypothetical protein n=1 Tax=unclassified Mesorhizobium TaxID=325217 RepID=UPI0033388D6E